MATKTGKKTRKKPVQLKLFKKQGLSAKQVKALEKGQSLMKKAQAIQKKSGLKKKTIVAGGKAQTIQVYAMNLNTALKRAK
jgi:hypothetical protein